MLFQSATPAECLVTFRTGKWLFYCVDSFMMFKSPLSVKTGHIWNRQVESFMLFQSTTPAECLVTFWTGKWLLSCEDPFMLFQNDTPVECLVIFPTGKLLISCVDPFMMFQSATLAEVLSREQILMIQLLQHFCHISNRQMASLLCGSFHDFQITTICK